MKSRDNTLRNFAGLLITSLFLFIVLFRREVPFDAASDGASRVSKRAPFESPSSSTNGGAIDTGVQAKRFFKGQVLARVNGVGIHLEDLIPLDPESGGGSVELSVETYEYLLSRAVNRELIIQVAKAEGITLGDSEKNSLAVFRSTRNEREPGQVRALGKSSAQSALELRDAEAFLLQTRLMAVQGKTPNVTPDQVESYYRNNRSEFGELPHETEERREAWSAIDFQIRQKLSAQARADFGGDLTRFMVAAREKSQVEILTPVD